MDMTRSGSATPPLLRRLNAARVVDVLRSGGPLNIAALAQRVGQSRATLDAVVEDLIGLGLVAEATSAEPEGGRGRGRPPRRLRFRAEAGHVVGVDVGAQRVGVVVTDLLGSVLAEHERAVRAETSRGRRLRAVRDLTAAALRSAGVEAGGLRAAGVATPGIVDGATGTVTYCNSIPDWSGVPLAAELGQAFGCAVDVDNDANLAAVGERWKGVAHGYDDVVLLLAGQRIGAGIVLGGELVRGRRGGTGELTFLGLLSKPDPGQAIERQVSDVVRETVQRLLASGDTGRDALRALVRDLEPLHGVRVSGLDEARAGQLETALAQVCRVAIVMTTLISPELLVLGGSAPAAGDAIVPAVSDLLDTLAGPGVEAPAVRMSTLGESAVALGAARRALDLAEPELLKSFGG
jgi:predicted NBD/HSP70 family sugar kinase